MKTRQINIVNIIGDNYAVEAEEGQKVYNQIVAAIDKNFKVNLSFLNIDMVTTAFLNSAVGQLYGNYSEEKIRKHFMVSNMSESGKISLKRVVETAKLHYKDADALKRSIEDILNE
ncbi:MAG TPA: STAS-like domain-containing protein [Flavobacteriaceae bacterium]|nr:STAS-like domain-containing protein [Flavobacteriaceae bacterium]